MHTYIHAYIDVSIMTQIIKRPGEGITATDGAGRSPCRGRNLYNVHRPIWMEKQNVPSKQSC